MRVGRGPEQRDPLSSDVDVESGGVVTVVDPEGARCELVEPRQVAKQLLCELLG